MTTGRYSYYYADSVTYSNGTYTLNNPKQYTSSMWTNSYRDLVGKYLCTSTESTTCSNVSYSIANVDFYLYPGSVVGTFTMSPSHYKADYPWNYYYMLHSGVLRSIDSNVSFPVRPSISLIPETLVVSGDGSSENPYIVDFPKN